MAKSDLTRADLYSIEAISFISKDKEDVYSDYCTGDLSITTEIKEVIKTCRGGTTDSDTQVVGMGIELSAFMSEEFKNAFFGLEENEKLKDGVKAYGRKSIGQDFTLVAHCSDRMSGEHVLFAFPKVKSSGGFDITVGNDNTEVPKVQYSAKVLLDDTLEEPNFMFKKNCTGADDPDIEQWLTNFSEDLVKKTV